MSISSISTATPATYQYTPTTSTSTNSTESPVVASSDPGLAEEVSALSTTASIVATLGTTSTSSAQTYDAAGLYNSIAQAGTTTSTTPTIAVPAAGSNTQVSAQQSLNSAIVSALPNSSTASGFYTGSGVLQSTASNNAALTANWASALHTNPNLAPVVSADSYAQGIVGTLSVTA
ncbi:MAG TPA: hypothetical protein VK832_03495 [Burkholderiaceae bacterium]|jgi:hypothetical protein|nr:hypothetical protein [Burkholderiaceae bacterium]